MPELILQTFLLALVQAAILNHWLPLTVMGLADNWKRSYLINVMTIAAGAHVVGTAIVGVPFFVFAPGILSSYEPFIHMIAPVMLIALGIFYLLTHLIDSWKYSSLSSPNTWGAIFVVYMLLSPCLEAQRLFTDAAAHGGHDIIILLALLYAGVNITAILIINWAAVRLLSRPINGLSDRVKIGLVTAVFFITGLVSFYWH